MSWVTVPVLGSVAPVATESVEVASALIAVCVPVGSALNAVVKASESKVNWPNDVRLTP